MVLVLPPSSSSPLELATLVAKALLAVALTWFAVPMIAALRRKLRIAAGLKPIPGPKGWPLLGLLPDILRNAPRVHEFMVRRDVTVRCLAPLIVWRCTCVRVAVSELM